MCYNVSLHQPAGMKENIISPSSWRQTCSLLKETSWASESLSREWPVEFGGVILICSVPAAPTTVESNVYIRGAARTAVRMLSQCQQPHPRHSSGHIHALCEAAYIKYDPAQPLSSSCDTRIKISTSLTCLFLLPLSSNNETYIKMALNPFASSSFPRCYHFGYHICCN